MAGVRKSLRVVAGFAAFGFALPWALLAYYVIAHRMGMHPSAAPLVYLCPTSIMSLGLENKTGAAGLLGWAVISVGNSVMWAIPGIVVSLFLGVRKSS
ncbi:MAG TPA: hypothetical protein VMJ93_17820 [Verrucomicrobiae bacterium]|nr:hypothetical protein [Verrucomicrobiae bacterium]